MKYIHILLRGTHVIDFGTANLKLWMRMRLHMHVYMDPIESFEQKICNGKLKNIKGEELPVSPGMEDLMSLRQFLIQWLIID